MSGVPDGFTFHEITVRALEPGGGYGPSYGSPVALSALVVDEQKLVRGRDGAEVVSATQVHVGEDVGVGSLVAVWVGTAAERESEVIAVARYEHPRLGNYHVLSLV